MSICPKKLSKCWFFRSKLSRFEVKNNCRIDKIHFSLSTISTFQLIESNQGPDLYAFIGFIGFIGPDDINYMCYILVIKY